MSLAEQIKPITYLKTHAAEIVKAFSTNPEPIIITQNGEAKMVVMAIAEYENQQETIALLKLIALGRKKLKLVNIVMLRLFLMKWMISCGI
jgi:prevent-host-death family protein